MSFTFKQSKDFKRWGYDAEKYGVEQLQWYSRQDGSYTIAWDDCNGELLSIPTLEGVMKHYGLSLKWDTEKCWWWGESSQVALPLVDHDAYAVVHGLAAAIEAKKVKGESIDV